jgi:flagellar basal-body rod protein FlgF
LRKDPTGLLVARDGGIAAQDDSVVLANGFLESSNVSSIDQLVATMSLSRLFETQVKMMKAADSLADAGNRMIRGS